MASILPGYEYDIFISYRQKDNKQDGWVTQFVETLRNEIEATFKEDISIYFDENPHDGLLETHDVDRSLEKKLKCLIFIPIISQTYCDPDCFAWQHEFLLFRDFTKNDDFGLDLTLVNGNVAKRILPIRIHEISNEDRQLLENEIGGVLRSVDFIYKESGVNRPLGPDDNEEKNLNKTRYKNQINKTANAIKEMTDALLYPNRVSTPMPSSINTEVKTKVNQKSILVLPFVNMSNDSEQEYFSDGLTEEIIADLSKLHDLLVISRSSSMTFKSSKKNIREMAQEVNVRYVLEGSVRKSGNNLRITAQLIDAQTDGHLWAEKYNGVLEDVFDIQESVSRSIVGALKIKLTTKENNEFSDRPIHDISAYDCYLRAKRELNQWNAGAFDRALKLLESALDIVGPNAILFAGIAYTYWNYANLGLKVEENTSKCEEYVNKAFELDPSSPDAHLTLGLLCMSFRGESQRGLDHFKQVLDHRPNDYDAIMWIFVVQFTIGKLAKARDNLHKMDQGDPLGTMSICGKGFIEMYRGKYNEALPYLLKSTQLEPENGIYKLFYSVALACSGKLKATLSFLKENGPYESQDFVSQFLNIYERGLAQKGDDIRKLITPDLKAWGRRDLQFSHLFALIFCFMGMKVEAYEWLENAVNQGFCNYPLLSTKDPLKVCLKGDKRFEKLMLRMKKMWDKFE